MRLIVNALLLIAIATPMFPQSPAADWMTVETEHFRVHYPRQYEEWAMRAAGRLEAIRAEVSGEIGFVPPQTIDVIVTNPVAQANGIAWPLLDAPRMIFYTEPPGPEEQLGAYGNWIDLLAIHETAHLVHMLRPPRNPLDRLFAKSVLPLNPITLRAPRWVLEGYATVIEGRLTGAGRPNSTIRALILRRWAESGRLPTYAQLNSDRRFLGMSMAYLTGSAFLEWLERRSGPGSLRNLWSRMTARQRRSFNEAFVGVFGDRPDRLYGIFTAELTASAVAIARQADRQEGDLFQESPRASGEPEVSPDGTKIAYVIRAFERPDRLVIWSTGPDDEAEKRYAERIGKILARDPEDVAPVRTRPLPRKALHELVLPDGGDIASPRWTGDGSAILFTHRVADADGFLHFDLYRWDFETITRVTELADVRDADPYPDGRRAIGVLSRHGKTALVEVDLTTGAVTGRGEESAIVVVAQPAVSPDGTRVAHVAHRGEGWTLHVDDVAIALPGDAASPEWISNDTLLVTLLRRGFAELARVRIDGTFEVLTRTAGGAFDPTPAADGRVFFTSLDPDGYVLRVLPADAPPVAPLSEDALTDALVPAIAPAAARRAAGETDPLSLRVAKPYGIGRQEFSWFSGTNIGQDEGAIELGARFGDVIGRLDTLVIGSLGREEGTEGVAIASAYRGLPVEIGLHVFHADRRGETDGGGGGELRARWSRRFSQSLVQVDAGTSDLDPFAGVGFSTWQRLGTARADESLRADVDGEHYRVIAALGYRAGPWSISARYRHDGGSHVRVGGLDSSLLPRSAILRDVLDPALPRDVLSGDGYDGWRVTANVPVIPFQLFYQQHRTGLSSLALTGARLSFASGPVPILKLPAFDLSAGVAYALDAPIEGDTRWWLELTWHP